MPRTLPKYVFILLICVSWHVFAALDLELTQGTSGAQPIAVMDFLNENTTDSQQTMSDVIRADLQNSGRFRVLENKQSELTSHTPNQIDYDHWRKQGAESILIGAVKPVFGGKVKVTFSLMDVFSESPSTDEHLQLSQSFTINKADIRSLAHHISDLVYQKLLSERGVFSTRIAYVLVQRTQGQVPTYTLEIADYDGHNPIAVLTSHEPIMSPSWSPDGKKLAYVSFEHQTASIYISDVETGKRVRVTHYPGINGAPSWSPNGKKLTLVLSKDGAPKVYVYSLAKGHLHQLTRGWSIDTEPRFSPDGSEVIFTSNRGGGPQIYAVKLSNRQIERLTFDGHYNARATFTPDGNDLIFLTRVDGMFNIGMQNLNNGRVDILTKSGMDESPSVSPNGQMVIYGTHYGGNGVLGVVSIDGRVRLRLPSRNGDVQEPAWSPFLT